MFCGRFRLRPKALKASTASSPSSPAEKMTQSASGSGSKMLFKTLQRPLRIAEHQHAISPFLERVADRVLHADARFDQHHRAILTLALERRVSAGSRLFRAALCSAAGPRKHRRPCRPP